MLAAIPYAERVAAAGGGLERSPAGAAPRHLPHRLPPTGDGLAGQRRCARAAVEDEDSPGAGARRGRL